MHGGHGDGHGGHGDGHGGHGDGHGGHGNGHGRHAMGMVMGMKRWAALFFTMAKLHVAKLHVAKIIYFLYSTVNFLPSYELKFVSCSDSLLFPPLISFPVTNLSS
ncbi:hypothetical protein KC19_N036700 [Ceratodon purpureus]|nr:hypothetical protein KC19_N036700 [Ceratodon purpureus]